ncbi:hypothetical protein P3342_012750 [Pyrenophora teres f. teres]|nr:hypothetical protein P3342_012750 [Pyrenophora teres f. teres]
MYSFILLMLLFQGHSVIAKDECQPITWNKNSNKIRAATSIAPTSTPSVVSNVSEITILDVSPGEINCRSWFDTGKSVNYYTCTQISNMFEISTDQFFALNPEIKADCSNIMPLTTYCVDGLQTVRPVPVTKDSALVTKSTAPTAPAVSTTATDSAQANGAIAAISTVNVELDLHSVV